MGTLAKVTIGLLIAFVVLAGAGLLFSARPTPLIGVSGDALAHSFKKDLPDRGCREESGGDWACRMIGDRGPVTYEVDVGWDGCWDATRVKGPVDNYTPEALSGCVDIWDHLRLEDTLN